VISPCWYYCRVLGICIQAPHFFLPIIAGFACLVAPQADKQTFTVVGRRADFKTIVDDVPLYYAYVDRPEKPWKSWAERYRAAVDSAATPAEFAAVVESALAELHDFHAEVRFDNPKRWLPVPTCADMWADLRPDGAMITSVREGGDAQRGGLQPGDRITAIGSDSMSVAIAKRLTPAVDNLNPKSRTWAMLTLLTGQWATARQFTVVNKQGETRSVTLPSDHQYRTEKGALSWKLLPGNFGYIRFNNSLGDMKTVAAFDDALAHLRSTLGLVMDLRDVPSGGGDTIALGILGRFASKMLPYQVYRYPHYGQVDIERNSVDYVAPRGPFTYKAPLVVLVDHWTGSMGEGMAIGIDGMHRGLVIGTPMAHLAGAVTDLHLPNTGVDIAIPTMQINHVNGTPRQDWLPPMLIRDALDNDYLVTNIAVPKLISLIKATKKKG